MLEHINLKDGVISHDNFTWLIDHSTFMDNIDDLSEDLLLISFFEGRYSIDVGWYSDNRFSVLLIKDMDWQNPVELIEVQTPNEVIGAITSLIELLYSDKDHS